MYLIGGIWTGVHRCLTERVKYGVWTPKGVGRKLVLKWCSAIFIWIFYYEIEMCVYTELVLENFQILYSFTRSDASFPQSSYPSSLHWLYVILYNQFSHTYVCVCSQLPSWCPKLPARSVRWQAHRRAARFSLVWSPLAPHNDVLLPCGSSCTCVFTPIFILVLTVCTPPSIVS